MIKEQEKKRSHAIFKSSVARFPKEDSKPELSQVSQPKPSLSLEVQKHSKNKDHSYPQKKGLIGDIESQSHGLFKNYEPRHKPAFNSQSPRFVEEARSSKEVTPGPGFYQ